MLSDKNFHLPDEKDVNYCIEGTNIIIDRENCFREDVKNSTVDSFEFLGDFSQIDLETISVAIDGHFIEDEIFNIDYLNERLQFNASPSDGHANLRVTYCLKEDIPVEEQTPNAYFDYSIESDNPLEVEFISLSKAQVGSKIESARYIINGGEETIELSDTLYKSRATYLFSEPNFYNVELVVTDDKGRSESFSRVLDLTQEDHPPILNLEIFQINHTEVLFDLTKSFDPDGGIEAGEIDFGDGNKRSLDTFFETYTYQEKGTYQITVLAYDDAGNETQITRELSVDDTFAARPPVADFYIDKLDFAGGFRLYFAEPFSVNGEIVEFSWDLGDGESSSSEELVHYYEPGVYDVSLTVKDELGLIDTKTQRIVVHGGGPFVAHLDCWSEDPQASCDWSVLDSTKNLQSITIDWGDGAQMSLPILNQEYELYRDITYEYPENGYYEITIQASNGNGDTASATQEMSIFNAEDDNSGGEELFANFGCNIGALNIQCVPFVLDQSAQFSWKVDGEQVSEDKELDYNFSQRGTYEIGLEVFDLNGASEQKTKTFQVPEELSELISGELACIKEGSLNIRCMFSPFSDEANYNYQWFIDGAEISASGFENQIRHEFFSFDEYEIKVLAFNEFFQKEFKQIIEFDYENPLADFSYALAQGDRMSLDASASESEKRHVEQFEWQIEGEDVFTTATPDFEIDFERVANKKVTLTVSDDSGNSDIIEKVITVDENYKAPVANIEISQRRGRADRTVNFDASKSYDPNDQALNFKWTVDGQVFNQEVFSYDFSEHGEYEVSLEVTNGSGRGQTIEETFVIEPLKFDRFVDLRFEPGDTLVLFFENYQPDSAPQIFVESQELEVVKAQKNIWGALLPLYDISGLDDFSVEIDFIIDEFSFNKTFYPKEILLSDTPLEDIEQILTEYTDYFYDGAEEFVDLLSVEQSMLDLRERVITDVNAIDDKEFHQYTAYFLRKFLKEAKQTQVLTSFHERNEPSTFDSILGLFMNTAHARDWHESELNAELDSCYNDLGTSRGVEVFVRTVVWGASAFPILFNLSEPALPAKAVIALAVGVGVFEVIAKIPHMAINKRLVKDCLNKALFPYEGGIGDDVVDLEFVDSVVEQYNERPIVPGGAPVAVRLTYPLVRFTRQVPSIQEGRLFKRIDNMTGLYDDLSDNIGVVFGFTNVLRNFTKKALEKIGITTIENFGLLLFEKNVKGSLYIASEDADELLQSFERLDKPEEFLTSDRLISIEKNQISDESGFGVTYTPNFQGGLLTTISLGVSNHIIKPKVVKEETKYFSEITKVELPIYYVKGACPKERVYRHAGFLEGWVSKNSNVAPEVRMTNTTYVCGHSKVEKGFSLGFDTVIKDSELLGCGSVRYSRVTNGSLLKDGVSVINSQVEGLQAIGSKECGGPSSSSGTIRLDGVSSPAGVEIIADKEQFDLQGQSRTVDLSGEIRLGSNVRILNSQIRGKAAITGDVEQHINHTNIRYLDLIMTGGNIYNSRIMGPVYTNSHVLKINGNVDISNNSNIRMTREFGFSEITQPSLEGKTLKLDDAYIESEVIGIEGETEIIDSDINLTYDALEVEKKHLGNTLDVKNLKSYGTSVNNSKLADNITLKDSSIRYSEVAPKLYLDNSSVNNSKTGEANNFYGSSVSGSDLGATVKLENVGVVDSTIGDFVTITADPVDPTKFARKNITESTISKGVSIVNSDMFRSSASIETTAIEDADIKNIDLKGSSKVVSSSVESSGVRREIVSLDITADSSLYLSYTEGSVGRSVTIRNSIVGSSNLGNGVKALDLSRIIESTVQDNITVRQSRISGVSIEENKQNNECIGSNINEPAVTINSSGEEVENPCYNPIYTPGE